MKKLMLAIAATLCLAACKKDDTGFIVFRNRSADLYFYAIAGIPQGTIQAGNTQKVQRPVGTVVLSATQASGLELSPIEKRQAVTVKRGETVEFVFP